MRPLLATNGVQGDACIYKHASVYGRDWDAQQGGDGVWEKMLSPRLEFAVGVGAVCYTCSKQGAAGGELASLAL